MEDIITKKEIYQLNSDMVSILTQKFIEIDGELQQVGENHMQPYRNFEPEREELQANEPEDIVNAVLAIWGAEPTIVLHDDPPQEEDVDSSSSVTDEQV